MCVLKKFLIRLLMITLNSVDSNAFEYFRIIQAQQQCLQVLSVLRRTEGIRMTECIRQYSNVFVWNCFRFIPFIRFMNVLELIRFEKRKANTSKCCMTHSFEFVWKKFYGSKWIQCFGYLNVFEKRMHSCGTLIWMLFYLLCKNLKKSMKPD